jgi:hypothetical protein
MILIVKKVSLHTQSLKTYKFMSNKIGILKYSEAEQLAAEKQILNFQKITNYRMKEYSIEELINLYQSGRDTDQNSIKRI